MFSITSIQYQISVDFLFLQSMTISFWVITFKRYLKNLYDLMSAFVIVMITDSKFSSWKINAFGNGNSKEFRCLIISFLFGSFISKILMIFYLNIPEGLSWLLHCQNSSGHILVSKALLCIVTYSL